MTVPDLDLILDRYRGLLYSATGSNGLSRVDAEQQATGIAKRELSELIDGIIGENLPYLDTDNDLMDLQRQRAKKRGVEL